MLGVREEPGRPLMQTLCAHLQVAQLLLILDNCEHVIEAPAQLANALLRAAPHVRILASSRERAARAGRADLPGAAAAGARRDGEPRGAGADRPAVQLFVERAQLHKPGFALTEREAPAVAELVRTARRHPAGARARRGARALAVADINARLHDRYKLLPAAPRAPGAAADVARAGRLVVRPAEREEQILLERLAVFAGGFDLAAAEAVCGAEPLAGDDVLDLLSRWSRSRW